MAPNGLSDNCQYVSICAGARAREHTKRSTCRYAIAAIYETLCVCIHACAHTYLHMYIRECACMLAYGICMYMHEHVRKYRERERGRERERERNTHIESNTVSHIHDKIRTCVAFALLILGSNHRFGLFIARLDPHLVCKAQRWLDLSVGTWL